MGPRYSLSHSPRHSLGLGAALGLASALGIGLLAGSASAGSTTDPQTNAQTTPQAAPRSDYVKQAALVDQEDQRIMQTRSVLAAILQIGGNATAQWKRPQLFGSAHGKTLVLPPSISGKAYTVADLEKYGGKYFRKQSDGSYLLGVHVFVADGAELALRDPTGPLVIRMGSLPGAFSSIISFGGSIKVEGTPQQPVQITSWDPRLRRPDTEVSDGRAYIRAVGGDFKMKHAAVSHLGFYSGRTGGIALTGTDRPASAVKRLSKEQRHAAKQRRLQKNKEGTASGGGPGDLETEQPRGTATHFPAADLVTGAIDHSTISGGAFGLFVSGSNQTQITDNEIQNSLVDGLVLHRFTKNANVRDTRVTGSGGDGFVLSRATEKIRVNDCVAERNKGNGFTVNGQPLAEGPSASGESLERFGDSSVNNSLAKDNGRYGVELLGGDKLAVQNSKIIGGAMGIVVRDGAFGTQISGNQLLRQSEQSIALRDGVREASLAGNTVVGARTGIYLRNASGTLVGNVVQGASAHGITLVGDAKGSQVRNNTLSGSGTSAVSDSPAHGKVKRTDNNIEGWNDTASVWTKAKRYAKPMNLIWSAIFALVVLSMLRARGNGGLRIQRTGVHPYELQRPLEERPAVRLPRRVEAAARAAAQAVSHRLPGSPPLPGSHHHLPEMLGLSGSDLVRASTKQTAPRPEGEGA
ncbi:right-handed parallel beta-helix repeat-containing protein [Actinomadura rudentiformis]|uniref:Right-handed parallel beta-helix repeat-containing protein n=1 Tax=Actinomadura rudentiformis TaxID=359158 RepID=A0A6H9Z1H4_9ACTN|nr:right-handed parallel beta-helix repeat-containing protein [Actinomadura rudentiformis]KAB2348398.1 right-handed parallel beta-helix repeat-containing protein [Actinomadura rudentiformis]